MLDRHELQLIARVAQLGSLAAAARALGLAPSVATKRLAAIETRLGVRLFERSTRALHATPHGAWLVEQAQPVLQELDLLNERFRDALQDTSGSIRLASTFGFGRLWVGPALAKFQAMHPRIQIQLILTERLPDWHAAGVDAAIWLWQVPAQREGQWTAQRLAKNRRILVAAPQYLKQHGIPRDLEDLSTHQTLVVHENTDTDAQAHHYWMLSNLRAKQSARRVRLNFSLSSNSGELVRDWCIAGCGIALRSVWDIQPYLASSQLVHVLPQWAMLDADIHWVAPYRAHTPRRLQLLREYLTHALKDEPWLKATPSKTRHHASIAANPIA